jgi:hypothetical protein
MYSIFCIVDDRSRLQMMEARGGGTMPRIRRQNVYNKLQRKKGF